MKKFFAVCFLGLMSAGVAACAVSTEPTDEADMTEAPSLEPQTVGPCPFEWTCNHSAYYTTKSACTTACGVKPCVYEEYDNGHCIPR